MSYLLLQRHGNSYTLTSGISQGYLQRPFRKLRPQEMKGNYGKVDKVLASKSETWFNLRCHWTAWQDKKCPWVSVSSSVKPKNLKTFLSPSPHQHNLSYHHKDNSSSPFPLSHQSLKTPVSKAMSLDSDPHPPQFWQCLFYSHLPSPLCPRGLSQWDSVGGKSPILDLFESVPFLFFLWV